MKKILFNVFLVLVLVSAIVSAKDLVSVEDNLIKITSDEYASCSGVMVQIDID